MASLDLLAEVGFEGLFAFTYSPRPGTTAARLQDDVPEAEKRRRLRILNEQQQASQALRNASRVGSKEAVLVDAASAGGRLSGRSARSSAWSTSTALHPFSAGWAKWRSPAVGPTPWSA